MNDRAARQPAVDIAKLIAAVLVITIHTDPLLDLSGSANFVLVHIIARTAVPFFIVCTGFFLGKRFEYSHGRISNIPAARRATMKSAWKIGKLYLLCSVIYLLISIPQWISTGWFSAHAFLDWGVGVFLTGSYYHLWYLIEVFYALLVLALLLPILRKPVVWVLIVVLWIVEVLDYAYVVVLPSGIQTAFAWLDKLQMPFESVVRVLPLLLLGMVIARQKPWKWWVNLLGLVLSLVRR
ncbi:MAG: acyltransferase family protein [Clostridia bacterium]|nr:acyltransferase family protein [Clostridia bacterium]